MTPDLLLTRVRLASEPAREVDLHLRDRRIHAITPSGDDGATTGESTDVTTIDGQGHLALPGLVDAHAHVDKTMWGLPWRPHAASPGLAGLVANERAGRRDLPPVEERAGALFDAYLARGTTLIRTHVDVDTDQGLAAVEGVLAAADARRDHLDVEVVAFPQSGMLVAPGTAELMETAVRAGAHLVGGIDPAGFDRDAVTHLDTIFDIAERHGVGIDLHLHDRGSLGRWQMELVVDRTLARGMQGLVTISHAFGLCDGDDAIEGLLDRLAEADVALTTVAPGNVEPLPLDAILDRGIRVGLGQDGIRDLWSPWGDADMLARAALLSWRAGHRRDEDIARSVEVATSYGAAVLGREARAITPGARADIVLVDAATQAEAAVTHPPRELVVANGVVVHRRDTASQARA